MAEGRINVKEFLKQITDHGLGNVKVIDTDSEYRQQLSSAPDKLVVADFSADWCLPSIMMQPLLADLSQTYESVLFLKVIAESCEEAAQHLDIVAYPTFVFIWNEQEIHRIRGASEEELNAVVAELAEFPDSKVTVAALQHLKSTASIDIIESLAPIWLEVATALEFDPNKIESILSEYTEPSDCSRALMEVWLNLSPPNHARWTSLLKALRDHAKEDIASEIEKARENNPAFFHRDKSSRRPRREEVTKKEYEAVLAKKEKCLAAAKCDVNQKSKVLRVKSLEIKSLQSQIAQLEEKLKAQPRQLKVQPATTPLLIPDSGGLNFYTPGVIDLASVSYVIYQSKPQTHAWKGYGIRLSVPKNALPPLQQCAELVITASVMGQYKFPDDCEVVSGIYWISSQLLQELVTLSVSIEYSLGLSRTFSSLRFVIAKSSEQHLPYHFELCDGGVFTPHSPYGTLKVTEIPVFGLAIVQKKAHLSESERSFTVQMFYQEHTPRSWTLHFVVLPNLDVYKTAIMKSHETMQKGQEARISYEGDEVTLDIDIKGVTFGKWHLLPVQKPSINRESVRAYMQSQDEPIPKCLISLDWIDVTSHPEQLVYNVTLQGAKEPQVNITFSPATESEKKSDSTTLKENRIKTADNVDVINSDANYWDFLTSSDDKLHLVNFFAKWYPPSLEILPHFALLSEIHRHIHFMTVDGDKCQEIVQQLGINCFPSFVFIQNGKEKNRIEGADKPRLDRILNQLTGISDPDCCVTPHVLACLKSSCHVDVIKCLAEGWLDIAIHLSINHEDIENIISEQSDSTGCATAMLTVWMKNKAPFSPTWSILLRALRASGKEELAVQIESIQQENPSCFYEFPATQFPPLSDETSRTHEYKTPPTSKMLEDTITEASARMYPFDNPIQVPSCRVVRKEDPVPVPYVQGMDIIAETSFEVTSQAYTYDWRGHGVKLHFQQDSLPAGCMSCSIKIAASLSGQYILPTGYKLVSGIYLICCPTELSKDVILDLQQCSTQMEGLSFIRAEYTQEQLPYAFQIVGGGIFPEHSTIGSITLSKFSWWAIGWLMSYLVPTSDSQLQQYSAHVYYANNDPNTWKVLFAVIRNPNLDLEEIAFRKKLEATMQSTSKFGSTFPIEFAADRIELEIPEPSSGWRVFFPFHPAIFQKIVDSFRARPGDRIPYCQLDVLPCDGTPAGSILVERVDLKGAKEPYNYFRVECGPTTAVGAAIQLQVERPSSRGSPTVQEREGKLSVRNLTSSLGEVVEWEKLGIRLDVKWSKIKEIERENCRSTFRCKADLLDYWLGNDSKASWERVATALDEMDMHVIGNEIRSNYCISAPKMETTTTSESTMEGVREFPETMQKEEGSETQATTTAELRQRSSPIIPTDQHSMENECGSILD